MSVGENALELVMVTPTIGTLFQFSQKALATFDTFYIHTEHGKLVQTLTSKSGEWNASHLMEGIYFISASKNGRKLTQKIVVKTK